MRKKILKIAGYSLGVIFVSALVAVGALYLLMKRNVATTGNVLGISWYDEMGEEFIIDTADELYELAKLSTYYSFKDQTIRLGADIVINEGNAKDWEEDAPTKTWIPINRFAGTFDGQGHTISGLYAKGYNSSIALFSNTTRECLIQNLKITNSYFEGKGFGGVASVVSNGGANLKQIYSDAIINVKGTWSGYAGGICSKLKSKSVIEECWFDGVIRNTGRNSGGIVDDVNRCEVQLLHCLFSGEIYSTWSVAIDNASHYYLSRTGGLVGRVVNVGGKLVINDCLSSGSIVAEYVNQTGGVLGTAMDDTELICNDTYAVSGTYAAVGSSGSNGKIQSLPLEVHPEYLVGYKAYQWTTLDFENYWSVVENGTPILKCFAEYSPSIEGIQKAYDTSWYSETASESVIMTPEHLYGFYLISSSTDFKGKTIRLGADIVLNEGKANSWSTENVPENIWLPIAKFVGTFDGQGHTISGIYVATGERTNVGFFAETDTSSIIQNLKLQNSYIQGKSSVGSIVGQGGGTFTNVQSNAIIVATEKAGGILGLRTGKVATFANCTYSGRLSASGNNIGGMIGLLNGNDKSLKMNGCVFAGTVHTTAEQAGGMIGGVGGKSIVEITGCRSTGTVAAGNIRAGGFIGTIAVATKVAITKSLSSATVTAVDKQAGGFIGYTEKETEFSQVQFSGKATGLQQVGGLIGAIRKTKVTAEDALITGQLHATRDTEEETRVGGLFGIIADGNPQVTVNRALVTGELTYVSNHKKDCGEHVGQVQKGATYIAKGVYTRQGCCASGAKVGKGILTEFSKCGSLPDIFLKGSAAVGAAPALEISTAVKGTSIWTATKTSYPVLRIFANKEDILSGTGITSIVDTSWYDEAKSEYILTDAADLLGFTIVSMDTDFSGKTIKLGATVTLNEGDADTFATTAPEIPWIPIGKFAGTFDGQSNSIKGIYVPSGSKVGLFSETTEHAVVENLKLEEAYIKGTSNNGTGSIVGRGGGTFSAIYSDAIVKSENKSVGGIIGYINADTTMDQVQFAGSASANNQVGGLAANVKGANVTFTNCHMSGAVATTATKGHMNAGMLVGMIDANSDVVAIKCLAAGYLKPSIVSNNNYSRALVGKVTGNDSLFHSKNVVVIDDTDHVATENRGYIGIFTNKNTYTNCGWKGTAGSGIQRKSIAQMTDIYAYYNLNGLEFCDNVKDTSKPWVVMCNEMPCLRIFADTAQVADLLPHIGWYIKAEAGVGESENKPYQIATVEELVAFGQLVNNGNSFKDKYIQLKVSGGQLVLNEAAPSTLTGWEEYINNVTPNTYGPIGTTDTPFEGHFNGNGCTINGLYIASGNKGTGLFGATGDKASVKNLNLKNSYINGTSNNGTGSIVGRGGGTFSAIYSDAIVKSTNKIVGGIIGYINADTTMEEVQFTGSVTASNQAGGFASNVKGANVTFTNCLMSGTVATTATTGHMNAGMFVGLIDANSDVAAIKSLATGYLKPGVISSNNYSRALVGKVTGNDALFHGQNVVIVEDTDHVHSDNKGYIGVLNPKKDDDTSTYTNCGWKGTGGSGIKRLSIAQMTDIQAYYNFNGIEFCDNEEDASKPWVAMKNGAPVLRIFADTTQVADLLPHIGWYTKAEAGVGQSEDNPYKITTVEQLIAFENFVKKGETFKNKYVQLNVSEGKLVLNEVAPSTLAEWEVYIETATPNTYVPIGTTDTPFEGHFDGNGCTISGLYISKEKGTQVGLFGVTNENTEIKNLKLENSYIKGQSAVGSIVGEGGGTFTNVQSNAVIIAEGNAGGVLGSRSSATPTRMANCRYSGELSTSGNNAGGMVGLLGGANADFNFISCEVTGNVHTASSQCGGLIGGVGGASEVIITDCKTTGTVTAGAESAGGYIGIIAVAATVSIENGISEAIVTAGTKSAGGYIGSNTKAEEVSISDSLSNATVTSPDATNVGGYIGLTSVSKKEVNLTNVQFTGTVTGKNQVGGFVGGLSNTYLTVTDGLMTGNVQATIAEEGAVSSVGGICGFVTNANAKVTATRCMITGTIVYVTSTTGCGAQIGNLANGSYTANNVYTRTGCCASNKEVGTGDTKATINAWYKAEEDELYINNRVELFEFAKESQTNSFAGKTVYLGKDIVVNEGTADELQEWATDSDVKNNPIHWTPIGKNTAFAGNFDGQGFKISGLYISAENDSNVGMFSQISGGKEIKDLTLEKSYIKGNAEVGSIVGKGGGTFTNVHSNAVVIATQWAGGILGLRNTNTATLENCSYSGELSATSNNIGGMIGLMQGNSKKLTITNCEFTGSVSTEADQIGGFVGGVGGNSDVVITECTSSGTVSAGGSKAGGYIGTIANAERVTISSSSSNATVEALGSQAGGFVGYTKKPVTFNKVQFMGTVRADEQVGGFIGTVQGTTANVVDGLMSGTVTATKSKGAGVGNAGGICGIVSVNGSTKSTVTATRCLITGNITWESNVTGGGSNGCAEYIGQVEATCIYHNDYVYGRSGCCANKKYVSIMNGDYGTNRGSRKSESVLTGTNALSSENKIQLFSTTTEDGKSIWVAINGGFPTLRIFAEADKIVGPTQ